MSGQANSIHQVASDPASCGLPGVLGNCHWREQLYLAALVIQLEEASPEGLWTELLTKKGQEDLECW